MILLFTIALYYHVWRKTDRIGLLISTALALLCLYCTGSRTGDAGLFCGDYRLFPVHE